MRRIAAVVALTALASLLATTSASAAGRCGEVASRPWCNTSLSADARAELLLGALTQDEKESLLAGDELVGVIGMEGTHTGTSNGVPRVGLPPIYFSDGPVGPRQGKATGMPSPMSLAASFDPAAAFRHAEVIGDEVKRKGNDVVYAPAMNMQRTPLNGRTFEYFGEDPFLSGRIAVGWTKGVQSVGVMANAKHFAVNNQEGQSPSPVQFVVTPAAGSRLTVDARVDERTMREIYLPQFEATVKEGGAASIMCSYPRVNGQYACENSHLLEDILKGDWGFKGFVLTDYGAAKNPVDSLNNGLDLDIWPALALNPVNVRAAVASGLVSTATIDEHVRRQLRTLFAFGFFDRDAYRDDTSSIDQAAHHAAAADLEQQGIVLLKNARSLLPLDAAKLGKVAVIGPEANQLKDGGGSSAIDEFRTTTPRQAIEAKLGAGRVVFDDGSDAARAAAAAKQAEVAIVVVGDQMTEGADKACMGLNCSQTDGIDRDRLIEEVAAAQPNTVVLLQTGGPVLTPWRTKVPAIVEAWFPGQNGGTAMARVLFGDAEPGGRLPATFPVSEADQPTSGDPEAYPGVGETVQYKEGVLIGYRWFDEKGKDVVFPFGFGLTYTTFSYSGLRRERSSDASQVVVSAVVRNTGSRAGTAVPQLYVGMPEPGPGIVQPPFQLKGFQKVTLAAGRSKRVRFALDSRAFSYWAGTNWRVAPGCYRIGVGAHSRDLPLRGTVARDAACAGALRVSAQALRLTVSPRRVRAGRRVRLGFAVRSGGRAVRSALVSIAGRRVRTDARGRAQIRVRFGRAGVYNARATRRGYRPGTAGVRAVRSARFTG